MQDTRQGYADAFLTNLFLGYPQAGYVAEQVLPTLTVPDLTGLAPKLDEQHLSNPGSTIRTGLARAKRTTTNLNQVPYGTLYEHALEGYVTDLSRRQYRLSNVLTPDTIVQNVINNQMLIEKEYYVQQFVSNVNNYASGFSSVLSGTSMFSNAASVFEKTIETARQTVRLGCGNLPNRAVMNTAVRNALRFHPEVQSRLAGAVAVTNSVRDEIVKDILQVDEMIIGSAVVSTQPEGPATANTPGTKSDIWQNDLILEYVTPEPAFESLTFGYLLRLDAANALDGEGAPLIGVDTWYERARKTTFHRTTDFYTTWGVANTAAYIFKNAA